MTFAVRIRCTGLMYHILFPIAIEGRKEDVIHQTHTEFTLVRGLTLFNALLLALNIVEQLMERVGELFYTFV